MQDKLKIMVLTAEDSLKVFRMTSERVAAALARFPEFRGKVKISITRTTTSFENDPSWNAADYEKFRRDIASADVLVGYMFPLEEIAATAPRLRWIHIIGAGIEHLLPLDWLPEDVILTNNRGAHAPKTCEYVMMALLMLANHMPRLVCAQQKHQWDGHFVSVIRGSKAAILGAGKQGSAAALAAKRLGLSTVGVDIDTAARENFDEVVPPARLNEAMGAADYVVVTLPSTKETFRFIGEKEFAAMKEGAGFVNISRGRIVDTEALIASLKSGHLSGAVLDVFEQEPLPAESPLWSTPNLIMSPHMGCDDEENYIHRTFDIVFENLRRVEAGETMENIVDRKKGY
ncbi:MAG: D-2-hydroxyacid dehydrogenase [bacterium]|nr:D-2-hydroxyacid dehydrogenase [bacterium]